MQPTEPAPSATNQDAPRDVALIVAMTVFLDLLGFGLMIPVQPFFAEHFGASPSTVTLLQASYSAMQFLFGPMWGALSDRVGRRPILLISTLASASGFFLFGMAEGLTGLFAARLLSGFGNANLGTAQAALADVSAGSGRSKAMGLVGAAIGMGFILGPAIGGALAQIGPRAPAMVAASLGLLNFVLAARLLPETLPPERRAPAGFRHPLQPSALRETLRLKSLPGLLLLAFVVTASFAMMEAALSLFVERRWAPEALDPAASEAVRASAHKSAAWMTAQVMLVVGLCGAIVQGMWIGRLVGRWGEMPLCRLGLVVMILGLLSVPLAGWLGPFGWMLAPAALLLALGSSLVSPTLSAMTSKTAGPAQIGRVLGLSQSLAAMGRVIGPAASGQMFELSIDLPFFAGACGIGVALVIASTIAPDDAAEIRAAQV